MANEFEKVKELNADVTIRLQKEGDELVGFYHGSKTVPGKYGVSLLHIFETEAGEFIGVWGSGRLNFGLKALTPKNGLAILLKVVCTGTVPSSKGNDAYSFDIFKNKNKTTEAASAVLEEALEEDTQLNEEPPVAASRTQSRQGTRSSAAATAIMEDDSDVAEFVQELEEPVARPSAVTNRPAYSTSAANKDKVNAILGVKRR